MSHLKCDRWNHLKILWCAYLTIWFRTVFQYSWWRFSQKIMPHFIKNKLPAPKESGKGDIVPCSSCPYWLHLFLERRIFSRDGLRLFSIMLDAHLILHHALHVCSKFSQSEEIRKFEKGLPCVAFNIGSKFRHQVEPQAWVAKFANQSLLKKIFGKIEEWDPEQYLLNMFCISRSVFY